jgi:hypothetical protein
MQMLEVPKSSYHYNFIVMDFFNSLRAIENQLVND